MKKIQSICIVALLAAFALTSCNYTDLDPTDMVGPDKAFGNVQNVHKAVVGIYGKASLRSKLAVTEYIADDCVQGGDSGAPEPTLPAGSTPPRRATSAACGRITTVSSTRPTACLTTARK